MISSELQTLAYRTQASRRNCPHESNSQRVVTKRASKFDFVSNFTFSWSILQVGVYVRVGACLYPSV